MAGLTEWVFLVLSATQFSLGMLGNGFIGVVNGSGWFKSRRISLSDFITTNLALSRIALLWILMSDAVILVFFPKAHDEGVVMQVIDIFWAFTNHLSIWLATCLGVFYCLKITSFSHPTFLWLKWRVHSVVVWMLLAALLLSCGSAVSLIHNFKVYSALCGINGTGNVTEHFRKLMNEYQVTHVLGTLWNLPPLIMCLASYIVLILSLGRHGRRMQHNSASSSDASTEAHKRATKMMLSFLFLFLLYFLAFLITTSSYFLPGTKMTQMIGELITMIYPASHSFVFILGNSKLKQTFVEMLWCESGRLKSGSKRPFSP
ncbi:taste receptor type 2 member 3 [Pteropus alecto]|uniref:Taste receptor type 2 n=1 Tax=Pteropus alecto TaxID=9402 RepID=L5KS62_PTEAL|nr:taste receptor type 2 member 3 [Pteropus alecto]ELK13791.1 Taste receptor type 2 member 3 [Pteropus alecto]